jgi:hypothetical protein
MKSLEALQRMPLWWLAAKTTPADCSVSRSAINAAVICSSWCAAPRTDEPRNESARCRDPTKEAFALG